MGIARLLSEARLDGERRLGVCVVHVIVMRELQQGKAMALCIHID